MIALDEVAEAMSAELRAEYVPLAEAVELLNRAIFEGLTPIAIHAVNGSILDADGARVIGFRGMPVSPAQLGNRLYLNTAERGLYDPR